MKKDSIIIYRSFYEAIKDLPKEMQADAWQAIFEYGLNDNQQELTGIVSTVFKLIKPQLDANQKRFENGQKGGRPITKHKPKHNQDVTKHKPNSNQDVTKTEPNVNDNVNYNINDNYNDNVNHNVNHNSKELTNVSSEPSILDIFEFFWNAYQKRGNKATSLTAFKRLTKNQMIEIRAHIPKYLENHHRNGKMQFLPHFSSYLNKKIWLDILPYEDKKEKINNWGV